LARVVAPLAEVARMATSNAANTLGPEAEMGSLSVAMPADLSIMGLLEGDWILIDLGRVTHPARQLLHPESATPRR
jgi:predicted amidohydrolase